MDLDFLAPLIELDLDLEIAVYVTSMTGFFEEIDQLETLSLFFLAILNLINS